MTYQLFLCEIGIHETSLLQTEVANGRKTGRMFKESVGSSIYLAVWSANNAIDTFTAH